MRLRSMAAAAALASTAAAAQIATPDPDWKEQAAPPPPALQTQGLVEVDMGAGSELRFGIDPKSVAIGDDRVVRYVMVATSRSGAVNGIYEGLRCDKGEYRIYARHNGQGWRPVQSEWRSLFEGVEGRRALAVARGGACQGRAPNDSPGQIVKDLATPPGEKFGGWSTR